MPCWRMRAVGLSLALLGSLFLFFSIPWCCCVKTLANFRFPPIVAAFDPFRTFAQGAIFRMLISRIPLRRQVIVGVTIVDVSKDFSGLNWIVTAVERVGPS